MTPLADFSEVQIRLGEEFDDKLTAQVNAFLRDASAVVRRRVPTVDANLADGSLDRDTVVMVITQVVMRRMSGIGLLSEQHPEYSYTLSPEAANGLALTDDEEALLRPPQSGRAFSIVPR
ncbi:hypothetical protein N8J89_08105 [Crossiella sp. CA-258035]|uniref:hypothetical protein n=1 Tax=Crossiella sp. CA-258035 TaxID=2981138 RepID=UPI0024BD2176|nr:hypothetical protein [Crossiella sp. CA-258035]WHT21018.1 hypothetical protein N8J89_08105 [Crossiella sp. CA-258035]